MDKAMELLEQLAHSLGVAVEYLWDTLIKQQYVVGVTNIITAIIDVVIIIVLLCCMPKIIKFLNNQHEKIVKDRLENGTGYNGSHTVSSYTEDFYRFFNVTFPIVGCIVILTLIFCFTHDVRYGIQQLLNPDYFALKEVLETISGSIQ